MIQEVGFDNLPNSYISLIEISELSPLMNAVNVHLILKDVMKDGLFSWYKRDELGKYLKLLVVSSTNTSINGALDNGKMPLDKRKISSHPAFDSKQVQFREVMVGWNKSQQPNSLKSTVEGDLFEFEYKEQFKIESSESDLKVYCATFIDIQQFSQDYRLDLTHMKVSSYTGPVASEIILINRQVSRVSFVFKTPQGAIWSGPVRFLDGSYYSGSNGRANTQEILKRLSTSNTKIKDYRRPKLIRIKQSKVDNKLPPFPAPALSYNPDGSLSVLFSIDLRALLLQRSKLAARLAVVDEKLLQKVIQKIVFAKIVLKKQKIITRPMTSKSGTRVKKMDNLVYSRDIVRTKDSKPFTLIPISTDKAAFEEIILSESPNIRHFALRDYEDYRAKGEYKYVLEVEFDDPTRIYVDSLANEVEKNLSSMKYYIERTQMLKNQNNAGTRLTNEFITAELKRFGAENQPWNKAAQLFTTYYGMFLDLNEKKLKDLTNQSVVKIHPSFTTPTSTLNFMKEYSDLHQHFIKYFNAKIKRISNIKGKGNKGKSSNKGKIFARVAFKETVIHEERDKSITYYDFREDIYPSISIKEFISRTQKEKGKFYNSKPSLAGTNLSKLSKKAAEKLTKDANTVTGFFTPSRITAKGKKLDLMDPSSVDISAFNEIYQEAKKSKDLIKLDPKPIPKVRLNIKVAKKIDKYLEPSKQEVQTVVDNLGKSSKFRPAESRYKPAITSILKKKTKKKIRQKGGKKLSSKQFAADSKNVKQLIKKIDKIRLPPSLISVMASESNSTKNNVLTTQIDIAANPETKDFFSIMYTNPVQIETIKSYKKDSRGRDIWNSPVWGLLEEKDLETLSPIICRFTIFNTKMFETQGIDIHIANENFILSTKAGTTKNFDSKELISMKTILDIVGSTEKDNIEYLTSNPVKQSEDKNGPVR